jgi:putative N-acetylmannosamine-6-phosphate epimerase
MFLFFLSCSQSLVLITDNKNDALELKNKGNKIIAIDSTKKAGLPTLYTIKYQEKD